MFWVRIQDLFSWTYVSIPVSFSVLILFAILKSPTRGLVAPLGRRCLTRFSDLMVVLVATHVFVADLDRIAQEGSSRIFMASTFYSVGLAACLSLFFPGTCRALYLLDSDRRLFGKRALYARKVFMAWLISIILMFLALASIGIKPMPGAIFFERSLGLGQHPVQIAFNISGFYRSVLVGAAFVVLVALWNVVRHSRKLVFLVNLGIGGVVLGGAFSAMDVYSAFYRLFDPVPADHLALALGLSCTVLLTTSYALMISLLALWAATISQPRS